MKTTQHKLVITTPNDFEIHATRDFDAPKELVFEAFSRCEHLKRWWGQRTSELSVCEMDFRVGGSWRRVVRSPDGSEHLFRGEFLEIVEPVKISETLIYDVEFARDFPAVETITLEDIDGMTRLTAVVTHTTREGRDGHLHSGMEAGAAESYDRLEELLQALQGKS